ncbi:unnamed protein product [Protopolystoma xenopodis]|uniref:EGF-like domain-containing protein n=1 Tax=Protopolystoma xenopodis TaxID=117903 RepID=A0A3S5FFC8_9PLAT|nr:unnamed protein product [Protopolystoma xenopodis]
MQPCKRGRCEPVGQNGYHCICEEGWQGEHCEDGRLRGTNLVWDPLNASSFAELDCGRGTFTDVSSASSGILAILSKLVKETSKVDPLTFDLCKETR